MTRLFKLLAVLVHGGCMVACSGGEVGDLFPEPSDAGADDEQVAVGQVEQAITGALRGPVAVFGTRTGNSGEMCDNATSGQVCAVPARRVLRWSVTCLGCGADKTARMTTAIDNAASFITAAGLNWTNGGRVPSNNVPAPTVRFNATSIGGNGGTNIDTYVRVGGATVGLTELSGVVGSYVKRDIAEVSFDIDDIEAQGANSAEDINLTENLAQNAFMKALGIGGFPQSNNRCTSNALFGTKKTQTCLISNNEICALNAYALGNLSEYGNQTLNCGQ